MHTAPLVCDPKGEGRRPSPRPVDLATTPAPVLAMASTSGAGPRSSARPASGERLWRTNDQKVRRQGGERPRHAASSAAARAVRCAHAHGSLGPRAHASPAPARPRRRASAPPSLKPTARATPAAGTTTCATVRARCTRARAPAGGSCCKKCTVHPCRTPMCFERTPYNHAQAVACWCTRTATSTRATLHRACATARARCGCSAAGASRCGTVATGRATYQR